MMMIAMLEIRVEEKDCVLVERMESDLFNRWG